MNIQRPRRHVRLAMRRRSRGQAMIEYVVVLASCVILLTQAGNGQPSPVQALADAIRNYHKHYTYAMAIAYIPDCDYQFAYDKTTQLGDIASITGKLTVGFDRCVDWQNPKVPIPDIELSSFIDMPTVDQIGDKIKETAKDMVEKMWDDFKNPLGLDKLAEAFSFKIGDIF